MDRIQKFVGDQLSVWPMAAENFRALKSAAYKEIDVGGIAAKIQYNPKRIASTTADVSGKAISERPCFLCPQNRPKGQFHIKFEGRKGRRYNIQLNPYPLFPDHLVICRDIHTPQTIWHTFVDMMDFARRYPDFIVFYNGPQSGASAPDHMHFQAGHLGVLPLQVAVDCFLENPGEPLTTGQDAKLYRFPLFCRGVYALCATTPKSLAKLFYRLVDSAPDYCVETNGWSREPLLNMFAYCGPKDYRCIVVLRSKLRSHHYFSDADDHLTMTFGAADMAGHFVCPHSDDFLKADSRLISEILDEVTVTEEDEKMVAWRLRRKEAKIETATVGAKEFSFEMISDGAGPQKVSFRDGRIDYNGALYDELFFDAVTRSTAFAEPTFILHPQGGTVPLRFAGSLKFVVKDAAICAINRIGIENYLLSVLSCCLPADVSLEEAKAEAIRLRRQILSCKDGGIPHYTGLTNPVNPTVRSAIDLTWGKTE